MPQSIPHGDITGYGRKLAAVIIVGVRSSHVLHLHTIVHACIYAELVGLTLEDP